MLVGNILFWAKVKGTNISTSKYHFWIDGKTCSIAGKFVKPSNKTTINPSPARMCQNCVKLARKNGYPI